MEFIISIIMFTLIAIISVVGVYVLTGLTGMFSLGQAAFMAIGAYVSAIFAVKFNFPFAVSAILAILVSCLVGFIVGLPTVRLRRDYISLVTLGFGQAITAILNQTVNLTGGANGFAGIPTETSLPLLIVSTVVCIALTGYFKISKFGRQCTALKSDELAAKAVGINVPRLKMIAFLMSVAFTSYAGVLYAFYTNYVEPTTFDWNKSAEWVIMVFFGGVNSLTGSIFAAIFLTALPQALQSFSQYRMVFYAALVLLIINFKPSGVFGEYELSPAALKKLFTRKKEGGKA